MMIAANRWRHSVKPESPMIVMSCDGLSGVGVWCAAGQCWSQASRDNNVDLVNSVRSVRMSRPGLVTSPEEYKEIRDIVAALIQSTTPQTMYSIEK